MKAEKDGVCATYLLEEGTTMAEALFAERLSSAEGRPPRQDHQTNTSTVRCRTEELPTMRPRKRSSGDARRAKRCFTC